MTLPMDWPIAVGVTLRRREVHALVGGQRQGGIATPRGRADILVFTNPHRGSRFGYDRYEGLRADGTYAYTGEGQSGPQEMLRGNKAINDAARSGKVIRLFQVSDDDERDVTYCGAFTVGHPAYDEVTIPGSDGARRSAFLFRLEPIDADATILPVVQDDQATTARDSAWAAPDATSYGLGPVDFSYRQAQRIEFDLQARFGHWLISQGHDVRRLRLPTGKTVIEPDLYDATAGEVFEAKKSNARAYVRTAVGQALDYAHVAQLHNYRATPSILLPAAPQDDLIGLCAEHRIRLYVPDGADDRFARLTG